MIPEGEFTSWDPVYQLQQLSDEQYNNNSNTKYDIHDH